MTVNENSLLRFQLKNESISPAIFRCVKGGAKAEPWRRDKGRYNIANSYALSNRNVCIRHRRRLISRAGWRRRLQAAQNQVPAAA